MVSSRVRDGRSRVRDGKLRVRDGRSMVRDDRLRVRDDRLRVRDDRLRVRDDRLRVRDNRLRVRDDPYVAKARPRDLWCLHPTTHPRTRPTPRRRCAAPSPPPVKGRVGVPRRNDANPRPLKLASLHSPPAPPHLVQARHRILAAARGG